jgi:DnaJ family protein C protein 28
MHVVAQLIAPHNINKTGLETNLHMEFKDWRKSSDTPSGKEESASKKRKYYGRRFEDYVSEQIREAMERGEFDNLPGAGKPLNLDIDPYAGEKAMGYHLLKTHGYAPKEVELAKEIRNEFERAVAKLDRLRHQSRSLRTRRVPPFPSEKRAYNNAVQKAASEYEETLGDLNRKILTFNLIAPPIMHMQLYNVEQLVQEFRESCPLFEM